MLTSTERMMTLVSVYDTTATAKPDLDLEAFAAIARDHVRLVTRLSELADALVQGAPTMNLTAPMLGQLLRTTLDDVHDVQEDA